MKKIHGILGKIHNLFQNGSTKNIERQCVQRNNFRIDHCNISIYFSESITGDCFQPQKNRNTWGSNAMWTLFSRAMCLHQMVQIFESKEKVKILQLIGQQLLKVHSSYFLQTFHVLFSFHFLEAWHDGVKPVWAAHFARVWLQIQISRVQRLSVPRIERGKTRGCGGCGGGLLFDKNMDTGYPLNGWKRWPRLQIWPFFVYLILNVWGVKIEYCKIHPLAILLALSSKCQKTSTDIPETEELAWCYYNARLLR